MQLNSTRVQFSVRLGNLTSSLTGSLRLPSSDSSLLISPAAVMLMSAAYTSMIEPFTQFEKVVTHCPHPHYYNMYLLRRVPPTHKRGLHSPGRSSPQYSDFRVPQDVVLRAHGELCHWRRPAMCQTVYWFLSRHLLLGAEHQLVHVCIGFPVHMHLVEVQNAEHTHPRLCLYLLRNH